MVVAPLVVAAACLGWSEEDGDMAGRFEVGDLDPF